MQEKSFNQLVDVSLGHPLDTRKVKTIAEDNKATLPPTLPKGVHVPDENELEAIALWMADYRKQFPRASKREVRKAAQAHFNVRIFP